MVYRRCKSRYSNKKNLCVTLVLPLLPTQLSHMFVTLALVMEVARAFHTTISFITVATLSPPIIPIMFNQTETWLGYQSDIKKVDPLSGKGAWNGLSWKGNKKGEGVAPALHTTGVARAFHTTNVFEFLFNLLVNFIPILWIPFLDSGSTFLKPDW